MIDRGEESRLAERVGPGAGLLLCQRVVGVAGVHRHRVAVHHSVADPGQLQQLRRVRRIMIVAIVTFAAVITPSADPFSLFFMAVPMYLFYEASIVIGRIMKR